MKSFFPFAMIAMLAWNAHGANGVIYYNRITSLTTPATVRRVGGDGTGDQAVPMGLVSPIYPTISRDGRRLLVTAPDPARPFKISNNVFLLDLQSGEQRQVARYADEYLRGGILFTNDLGEVVGQAGIQSYFIHLPYHKALSPDGAYVVVMNLVKEGSNVINTNAAEAGFSSSRYPRVEVFRVADGMPAGLTPTVFTCGQRRDGDNQAGDGVDWHPSLNYVLATIPADVTATGGIFATVEGTVLTWLNPFVLTAPANATAFTSPIGSYNFYSDPFFGLYDYSVGPNDYAPAISPDGLRVAYVRHILRKDRRSGMVALPAQCSIRVINTDGTGDHQVLLEPPLPDGFWVTKVAWSPDGTQLAFDLAPQLFPNGPKVLLGDVTQSQIFVVNTNGSDRRLVAAAPAAYPSWGMAAAPPVRPTLQMTRTGNGYQIRVDGLTTGQAFRVEGSLDLLNWENLLNTQATSSSQLINITPNPQARFAFYRVGLQ